ncbi:hypothetical protein PASm1_04050 [Pasteurella multocida]|nr:hypothetical protein PASm1_04050 [Pasteurella multocida]
MKTNEKTVKNAINKVTAISTIKLVAIAANWRITTGNKKYTIMEYENNGITRLIPAFHVVWNDWIRPSRVIR